MRTTVLICALILYAPIFNWLPRRQASPACNGRGRRFQGQHDCQCFGCATGAACETLLPDQQCHIAADVGTPFMFEDYWATTETADITIKASDHLGYDWDQHAGLEGAIREIHRMVGNADTDGRHVVVGVGSAQMIAAALYALSGGNDYETTPIARVWAQPPSYRGYVLPASVFRSRAFHANASDLFAEEPRRPPNGPCRFVELVASPNNPDNEERSPTLREKVGEGCAEAVVMDHAYYWPHFVGIDKSVSYDASTVGLFTMSKLTGHASSRIGWAITPSAEVAHRLRRFIRATTGHVPRESQLRAETILRHVLFTEGQIFGYARKRMLVRWARLEAVFRRPSLAKGWQLTPRPGAKLDRYTRTTQYEPSPAYAWIRRLGCNAPASKATEAVQALAMVGVRAFSGIDFGGNACQARLSLLMREVEYDVLLRKLAKLPP